MTKRFKITITSIILVLFLSVTPLMVSKLQVKNVTTNLATRTVNLQDECIDYESILNEFEDATIQTNGTLTTFEGFKTIDASALEEFDNLSDSDIEQSENSTVRYYFTYDEKTNIVTISAEMKNENGEIEIEEISGVGFINDKNEIDAVMNIDGESILLSEMNEAGMIQNCGWFKKLIKKVVKVAVITVAVVAVAAATAAVVVATAGAAAPALVAAGVGITTTAASGIAAAAGVAAGALFMATVGTAALQAGTAISEPLAEGASQIIDKSTNAILSIIAKGVEYSTIAVTSTLIYELEKNSYHLAAISGGLVYISKTPIDRVLATWAVRIKLNVYTFYSENAYQVAKDACDGIPPIYDPAHVYETGTSTMKKGIFFEHWHPANHSAHCLFGVPYINL